MFSIPLQVIFKNVLLFYSCIHEMLVFTAVFMYLQENSFTVCFLSHSWSTEFCVVSKRGFISDIYLCVLNCVFRERIKFLKVFLYIKQTN